MPAQILEYKKRLTDANISNILWYLHSTSSPKIEFHLKKTRWSVYIRDLIGVALYYNPFISSLVVVCKNKTQCIVRSQDTLDRIHQRIKVMQGWFVSLLRSGLTTYEKSTTLTILRAFIEEGVIGVNKVWDQRLSLAMFFCRTLESLQTIDWHDYYIPINSCSTLKSLRCHEELLQLLLARCREDHMKLRIHFQVSKTLTKSCHHHLSHDIVSVFKELLTQNKDLFQSLTISDMGMYKKVYFLLHASTKVAE